MKVTMEMDLEDWAKVLEALKITKEDFHRLGFLPEDHYAIRIMKARALLDLSTADKDFLIDWKPEHETLES